MGEAKRRREQLTPVEKMAEEMTHRLVDEGLLVKAGFVGFMAACFPNEQPGDLQRQEMEGAFMAGAYHLWASVMNILDPGQEATDRDLARMALIQKELDDYETLIKARAAVAAPTRGNA
jgi:hypothetical protein